MRVEEGRLVFEEAECFSCKNGEYTPHHSCKFDGTPQRGKPCRECGSTKKSHNFIAGKPIRCPRCEGTGKRPETRFDYIPKEAWGKLEYKVIRKDRKMGTLEKLLGLGVYTCYDYGRAWDSLDDASLIQNVKESGEHQACKITKEDGTVCDYILILLGPEGYSVFGVFNEGQ